MSNGTPPYDYDWGDAGNEQSVTVSPVATTVYTVNVEDAVGCQASSEVIVEVVDVHCGNKGNKVLMCQNPQNPHTICVSQNAVEAHLAQGATLGSCDIEPCQPSPQGFVQHEGGEKNVIFESDIDKIELDQSSWVYPNPCRDKLYLTQMDLRVDGLLLMNMQGRIIRPAVVENHADQSWMIDLQGLPPGPYILRINKLDNSSQYEKIMIMD